MKRFILDEFEKWKIRQERKRIIKSFDLELKNAKLIDDKNRIFENMRYELSE